MMIFTAFQRHDVITLVVDFSPIYPTEDAMRDIKLCRELNAQIWRHSRIITDNINPFDLLLANCSNPDNQPQNYRLDFRQFQIFQFFSK